MKDQNQSAVLINNNEVDIKALEHFHYFLNLTPRTPLTVTLNLDKLTNDEIISMAQAMSLLPTDFECLNLEITATESTSITDNALNKLFSSLPKKLRALNLANSNFLTVKKLINSLEGLTQAKGVAINLSSNQLNQIKPERLILILKRLSSKVNRITLDNNGLAYNKATSSELSSSQIEALIRACPGYVSLKGNQLDTIVEHVIAAFKTLQEKLQKVTQLTEFFRHEDSLTALQLREQLLAKQPDLAVLEGLYTIEDEDEDSLELLACGGAKVTSRFPHKIDLSENNFSEQSMTQLIDALFPATEDVLTFEVDYIDLLNRPDSSISKEKREALLLNKLNQLVKNLSIKDFYDPKSITLSTNFNKSDLLLALKTNYPPFILPQQTRNFFTQTTSAISKCCDFNMSLYSGRDINVEETLVEGLLSEGRFFPDNQNDYAQHPIRHLKAVHAYLDILNQEVEVENDRYRKNNFRIERRNNTLKRIKPIVAYLLWELKETTPFALVHLKLTSMNLLQPVLNTERKNEIMKQQEQINAHRLINFKEILNNTVKGYIDYNQQHCSYSFWHHHGEQGIKLANDFLALIKDAKTIDLKHMVIQQLHSPKGNINPHSLKTILLASLDLQSSVHNTNDLYLYSVNYDEELAHFEKSWGMHTSIASVAP